MDGIAAIQARIREIESRLGVKNTAGGRLGASSSDPAETAASVANFAEVLGQAQAAGASPSPAAGGTLNKAGVDPTQWARDFLTRLGMPLTSENMRAVTAWEQAEGTAARFNPLATTQGGFAGATNFNSVGVKNYVSYADGLDANVKVIQNGRYANILAALRAGNSANAVAQAIASSPWGTGTLVERIVNS